MRVGVVLSTLAILACARSEGATIKAEPLAGVQDTAFVVVAGEFVPSDAEQFRSAVAMFPKAIVALVSNGGSLVAAIDIGQIRLRNYSTLVPDNTLCASACATAWLGGTHRFMGRQAMIGFHAAYLSQDGHNVETGAGNALLGAYLNKLGLPDRAVVFIAHAAPESMTWLSLETAAREVFPPPDSKPDATPAPPPAAPSSQPAKPPLESDAVFAKRVARNFSDRYKAAGMIGLKTSVQNCYGVAIKAAKVRSVEYCYLLDLAASAIDAATLRKLGLAQEQYWLATSVSERAAGALRVIEPANASIPQTLAAWGTMLNVVLREAAQIAGQESPTAPPPQTAVFTPPPGSLPYLFDQIKKPSYRESLNAIMHDTAILPLWVLAFVRGGNGVAMPRKAIQLGSGSFELYAVCQPNNCGGGTFYVLYSEGGGKAWALVTRDDQVIALLGDASPEQTQALLAARNQ
jgi:hypothetical protein